MKKAQFAVALKPDSCRSGHLLKKKEKKMELKRENDEKKNKMANVTKIHNLSQDCKKIFSQIIITISSPDQKEVAISDSRKRDSINKLV